MLISYLMNMKTLRSLKIFKISFLMFLCMSFLFHFLIVEQTFTIMNLHNVTESGAFRECFMHVVLHIDIVF